VKVGVVPDPEGFVVGAVMGGGMCDVLVRPDGAVEGIAVAMF
jgi:hypothetical protein